MVGGKRKTTQKGFFRLNHKNGIEELKQLKVHINCIKRIKEEKN